MSRTTRVRGQFNALRADTAHYYLRENELNRLGYDLLHNGYPAQSVEVFKLNAILFPASFNVYDSYGDACRDTGLRGEAIFLYQCALALNPASKGTQVSLRRLLDPPR
ncbi:hypothetical protein [Hymenobacter ruricola]|uniref:Tetratricopeptide repeat protein n=1 Tax=Hymenobacter ruricola TaxID=2791023 RepID=A0ABS0I437_9BACT|nr:hypothetical protein [Hymenobacter ruricola]MBF9221357.1 hypothetical protein [Hymenobacter ruricola]